MGPSTSNWWFGIRLIPLLVILSSQVNGDESSRAFFSKASCDFAVELLKSQSQATGGNVILSPSSVGVLLAILQQGARETTLEQLEAVLHLTADQSKSGQNLLLQSLQREKRNVTLEWGNRAYVRPGFELVEAFNESIRESFGAAIEELSFVEPSPEEAAAAINQWVKQITHDNINNLVSPAVLTPDTVFILLNAIYFRGLWDLPFKKELTKEEKFETSSSESVTVPFMFQRERFLAGEDPEANVLWVDLPFKDEQFSMLFLLPYEKHSLNKLFENLNGSLLQKIINDEETKLVTLQLPKFKLKEKVLLAKPLQELGLKDIFTEASNLQGITKSSNLRVSKIIHEAGIEIDEIGGTAFAATGSLFVAFSSPLTSDRLTFKADHPFLFFILDRTNKIPLFAGKMADPS